MRQKEIEYIKEIKGVPVFKFKDTNTINDAFKLVGYSIYTIQTDDQKAETGIVNFIVKDMDGHLWGCVKDIEIAGYNQLLEVESPEGDMIYVPLADDIVKEIDEEKRVILIDPPEGLRDLNRT